MHIAINCHSFCRRQFTGIGRYTSSLVEALSQIDHANRYSLYTTRGPGEVKKRVSANGFRNFSVKFDLLKVGIARALKPVDIYHAPGPEVIPGIPAKIVVTVHDLIYKTCAQAHTDKTIALSEEQFHSLIPRASKVICSSRSTLEDVRKYFPEAGDKACCIYQGVDKSIFYPLDDAQRQAAHEALRRRGVEGPYLLFVGTIEPRKNLRGLLEAYALLRRRKLFDGKLVVVGMAGWKSEGIAAQIHQLRIQKDVVFMGFVTSPDLRVFYNLAEALVFPSLYEGFGYPIVEAFSCGTAAVVSNISSCPELASDAALMVNPYNFEEIAEAAAKIIHDQRLKSDLRQKALRRAEEFDNLKTARETLKVYEEVYKG